jgi:PAS domain S-box-containing protein
MINHFLNKLQIRDKLIMLNLFITGIVFLIAAILLFISEYASYKELLLHNLTAQAKILASNSTASLVFNDQKSAAETLGALKTSPNIECAVIFERDGSVCAAYWRKGERKETPLSPPPNDSHFFTGNDLNIFQGIVLDSERIGTIYIRSDLKKVYSLMMEHVAITLLTLLLVFAVAYMLMAKWQMVITEPIFNLLQSMKTVSQDKNYALEVPVFSEDEIGSLAHGFNEMLEQIQHRDMKLLTEIVEHRETETRLRQAKEEWERTFNAIVDPVMITDVNYSIIKVNRAMADKLGIDPADMNGVACYNAVHGSTEPPLLCPHSKELSDGRPHSVEIYEERLGGYFIVSVSPLFNLQGEFYGSVHYARDITKRKLAEEEVRRLNKELEWTVEERTKELFDAQEELVRQEKLAILGQLSGSVGHELRNPLGVMNNAIYFLKTVMTGADEIVKEYLDIIKQEIDTSQRIITDLLDFARTKTPQKRAVPVRELLEESLVRCALPKNVDIHSEVEEKLQSLMVDPLQVGQVFQNLITNGIQAMPNGGALCISARQAEIERGFIEICVADSGSGISPENMKKLFQPLFTTKAKGIGLGLTVCRNLTEANGGRIAVESEMGKGTRFVVLLPTGG